MGNVGSNTSNRRRSGGSSRRSRHSNRPPSPQPQPEAAANPNVSAASGPYYPPPPPHDELHRVAMEPAAAVEAAAWVGGRYPCAPVMQTPTPYVDHQKSVTIRNDVNLKKETLKIENDEQNPGKFLLSFTFDATSAGCITVYFFAKEGDDCDLTATKQDSFPPITVTFEQGLGQKFRQASGTGIDLSTFEETELLRVSETEIYPLAVKAEAMPEDGEPDSRVTNLQITQTVFVKDRGEYQVRVVKQILWVNGMRYELQEIYGIGNSVDGSDFDANDPGKECVICLSEPRDTTVLPCRHMCMCNGCAKVLRFQTNRCPICRQPVERLLEIKVSSAAEDLQNIRIPSL